MKRWSLAVLVAFLFVSPRAADADVSKGVQAKLKGQIIISARALPEQSADDAATVAALKKAAVTTLKHIQVEGVPTWRFNFIAFMSKRPGVTQVSLDFYVDDKSKAFVAQKRLAGIDKNLTLLESQVDLSEDDGLNAGRSYIVKLAAEIRGKDVVLATTKLTTR